MSDSVTVSINKDDVQKWIESIIGELPDQTGNLVLDILNILSSIAEVLSPFRSGYLKDHHIIQLNGLIGDLDNTAPYFPYIILGTSPHPIYPVNKQALWWPGALNPVKMVNHPGTAANDYMSDTLDSADGAIDDLANNFLEWMVS